MALDLPFAALLTAALLLGLAPGASANHPVLVEGNCFGSGMGSGATGLQTSPVDPGTCGDADGDGLIGAAEDGDGDNNFGTIGAALAAVAQNGRVTIVTSGVFAEGVLLNPADSGNVSLEAAPGVDANIDAVVQGDPGSGPRQGGNGIVIDGCDTCRVTVRNVMIRNWLDGVLVKGSSHATLDGLRLESNLDTGIRATDAAEVAIRNTQVNATGFRKGGGGIGVAAPGVGILVEGAARVSVSGSSVTGSAADGVRAASRRNLALDDVQLFDNSPDRSFKKKPAKKK